MKDGPLLKWCEEDNEGNIWSEPVYDDGTGESVIQYGLLNIDGEVVDGEVGLFYINPDDEYTIISEISIGLSVKYAKQACEDHARAELEKLAHYFEPQEGKIEFTHELLEWEASIQHYSDDDGEIIHSMDEWAIKSKVYLLEFKIIDWSKKDRGFLASCNGEMVSYNENKHGHPSLDEAKKACESHARKQLLKLLSEAPIRIKPDEPVTGKDCKWRRDNQPHAFLAVPSVCTAENCPMYNLMCPDNFGCTCAERQEEEDGNIR